MTVTIEGMEDASRILTRLIPTEAKKLMRSTVHAYAGRITKKAKQNVRQKDIVLSGRLIKSIKTKRRRGRPGYVQSDVIVSNKLGFPFYWHHVEFGTVDQPERPFFRPAIAEVNARRDEIFLEEFAKKLEKQIERRART
jgi:HK97 gp10 family phage protein